MGTKIRTILAIATSLNTALMATDVAGFENPTLDTIYKSVSVCLNFVIVACVTYYNNDYTTIASEYTGQMRLMKDQMRGYTDGEDFTDEIEEEEGDE